MSHSSNSKSQCGIAMLPNGINSDVIIDNGGTYSDISNEEYSLHKIISLNRKQVDLISVMVENKIIKEEKSVICKNQRLKGVIEENMFNGVLELYEKVTENAFLTLMKYYKEISFRIDDSNIGPLFTICFYYNEESLLDECIEYIKMKNNVGVGLTIALLKLIIPISTCEKYSSLYRHIVDHCKYSYNEIIKYFILELDEKGIEFILNVDYLEIDNENMLVKKLKYYYDNMKDLDDDFIPRISEYINWNRVDKDIKRDSIFMNYCEKQSKSYNRIYILEFPEFSEKNDFIDILELYYNNEVNFVDIDDDTFEKFEEIEQYVASLKDCLFAKNRKLSLAMLRCLCDAKLPLYNFMVNKEIADLLDLLLKEYTDSNNSNIKRKIIQCMTLFEFGDIKKELRLLQFGFPEIKSFCLTLLSEPYTNKELYNIIYSYLRNYEDENSFIGDNQLIEFAYDNSKYRFHVNEAIEIKPQYSKCKDLCVFSVSPRLPNGITIDRRNGVISGSTLEITDSIYTVRCNCPSDKKKTEISLSIGVLTHFSYPEKMYSFNLNEEILLKPICDGDYCVFEKNFNLPDGLNFDTNTGIISGKVSDEAECRYLLISCTDAKGYTLTQILDLYFGIITKFTYPFNEIYLKLNEEVYLMPIYDGNEVYFETERGLILDTETGCIEGNLLEYNGIEEYTIYAYNKSSTKTTSIKIISGIVDLFEYDTHTLYLTNNSVLYMKPRVNEGDFTFTITPNLPDGLMLNRDTGEISGEIAAHIMDNEMDNFYTITCKSIFNEMIEVIQISYVNQISYIPKTGVKSCKNNYIRLMYNSPISLKLKSSVPVSNFSIYPELPEGLMILNNGDIVGESITQSKKTEYKITFATPNAVNYHYYNISVGELIMFYYDKKLYNIKNGERIDICCHYEGDECEFSITPELPPSVSFDNKSGRIYGKWDNTNGNDFTVTCRNNTHTLHAYIKITYDEITYFSYKQYYFKFQKGECFSLKPDTDGENLRFSVEGELPKSIKIDENSGIISGSCDVHKTLNLIVECRNNYTSKKCEFTLDII